MTPSYYVIILECADRTLYCTMGKTVENVLWCHKNKKAGETYTRGRLPVKRVWSRRYEDITNAIDACFIIRKMSRKSKLELINNVNK